MGDDHELNEVAGRWIVVFKRRAFSREFSKREDADAVIKADAIYSRAERETLYAPSKVYKNTREIARQLRQAADDLQNRNIDDFTIREFRHVADILDPPAN